MMYRSPIDQALGTFALVSRLCGGGQSPRKFTRQSQSAKTAHNKAWTSEMEQIVMYLPQANRGRQLFDALASPGLRRLWDQHDGKHRNVCRWSTPGCRAACLGNAGHLGIQGGSASRAMLARYVMLCLFPDMFWLIVDHEIGLHKRRVGKCGKTLVVRINGTSDLMVPEEARVDGESILDRHPDVKFQDYTKRPLTWSGWSAWYTNYYVVRSITERDGPNPEHDGNYVVPVDLPRGAPLPKRYMGRRVIDGDVHDLRCADRQGQFAVLVRVKKRTDGVHADTHGFIRPVPAHV
jgi:hypothetical protein